MHDAKMFGWKVGTPEHDWETMVETVQNHVKMLNFRYRVGLKSAHVRVRVGGGGMGGRVACFVPKFRLVKACVYLLPWLLWSSRCGLEEKKCQISPRRD